MRQGNEQAHWGSNIFMARRAFKRDVLRIHLSDLNEIAREPTSGIRQGSAKSSGDPTSRILSLAEEQISSHDGIFMDLMIRGR